MDSQQAPFPIPVEIEISGEPPVDKNRKAGRTVFISQDTPKNSPSFKMAGDAKHTPQSTRNSDVKQLKNIDQPIMEQKNTNQTLGNLAISDMTDGNPARIQEIKDKRKKLLEHLSKLENQIKTIEARQQLQSRGARISKNQTLDIKPKMNSKIANEEEDPSLKAIQLVKKMNEQRRLREQKAAQELQALKAAAAMTSGVVPAVNSFKQQESQRQRKHQERIQLNRIVRERIEVKNFVVNFLKQLAREAVRISILSNPLSMASLAKQTPKKSLVTSRQKEVPAQKQQHHMDVVLRLDPVHHIYPKARFLVEQEKHKKDLENFIVEQRQKSISVRKKFSKLLPTLNSTQVKNNKSAVFQKSETKKEKSPLAAEDKQRIGKEQGVLKKQEQLQEARESNQNKIRQVSQTSESSLRPVSRVVDVSLMASKTSKIAMAKGIIDISISTNFRKQIEDMGTGPQPVAQQTPEQKNAIEESDLESKSSQSSSFIGAQGFLQPRNLQEFAQKQPQQLPSKEPGKQIITKQEETLAAQKVATLDFQALFLQQFQVPRSEFQMFYEQIVLGQQPAFI